MSSIVRGEDGNLYYSYPSDYYSRANMTIATWNNQGENWLTNN